MASFGFLFFCGFVGVVGASVSPSTRSLSERGVGMATALNKLQTGVILQAIFGYHVGVVSAGLLLHPYKTVQEIVRRGIPGSAIMLPTLIWIIGFLILRTLEHFLYGLLPALGFWWFIFVWGTVFLLFWQLMLLYLFIRFASSLGKL